VDLYIPREQLLRWRIRYSSKDEMGFVAGGIVPSRIEAMSAWARRWDSREAAVAFVLRFIDARIVSSIDQLSTTEPTCFVEEFDP
jgi:hypothetical protein